MPWIIDKIRDILPNRPYGKTAKDFRVARLIDLNRVIDSVNEGFANIGSAAPVDVTYNELYDSLVNGTLVPGTWYRVSYRSVNFLNGWDIANNNPTSTDPNFDPREIYEGEEEILLVQATSPYEIAEIGYSETFNGDIVQYEAYTNKIGVDIGGIANGNTLPDSSLVSGFDLQWDGTNVYFNMPTGYPALFGHYFYLYAEFDGGNYYQEGCFEPLIPGIATCQYPYTSDDVDYGYPKAMSRIKVEEDGMKVILLDLTETDFNNYDADTLYVDTVYALGDAYGWITRRQDTLRNIDVPFDFRGRKYRRFEVDLSSINPSLGTGYYGQGDNYLGQGTTGNYKDFKSLRDGRDVWNVNWDDMGGADMDWYRGFNDNNVFGAFSDISIKYNCRNNTIGNTFQFNTIGDSFQNNTAADITYSNIASFFQNNQIGSAFQSNTIGGGFNSNIIGGGFQFNTIGNGFNSNTIGDVFQSNTIGNGFNSNTIGNGFNSNTIRNSIQFYGTFSNNTVPTLFSYNDIQYVVSGINFTGATHVLASYNCTIFRRSDNTLQLSYIDGTNTVQYTAITA